MKLSISIVLAGLVLASYTYLLQAQHSEERFVSENSPLIAFTDARVIDGTGAAAMENQTVVIRDGRIIQIGSNGKVAIPKGAKQISLRGKSLLPGWVMMHEHLFSADSHHAELLRSHPLSFSRLLLAAGVTSARTAGAANPYLELRVQSGIEQNEFLGPDYDLTAPMFTAHKVSKMRPYLTGLDDVKNRIRFWADRGFTSFKTKFVTLAQMEVAIKETHKRGLKLIGHTCNVTYRDAAELGIDQIEHGFWSLGGDFDPEKVADQCNRVRTLERTTKLDPASSEVQAVFRTLIQNNVVISSTLEAWVRAFYAPHYMENIPDDVLSLMTPVMREHYQLQLSQRKNEKDNSAYISKLMALEAAFWRAGGILVVGSDAVLPHLGLLPGYSNLRSIKLLAEAGIPPVSVIKIATHNGAEAMGVLDDRGTVEVGKRADLLVINGDPSRDIDAIDNIDRVFKRGVGFDPKALRQSVGNIFFEPL